MEKFIQESIKDPATHDLAMGRKKKKKSQPTPIKCPGKSLQGQIHRIQTTQSQYVAINLANNFTALP